MHGPQNPLAFLAAGAALAMAWVAIYSLRRGEVRVRTRYSTAKATRRDNPIQFWSLIALQGGLALYLAWLAWSIRYQG